MVVMGLEWAMLISTQLQRFGLTRKWMGVVLTDKL